MKIIIALSWIIQVVLGFLALKNLIYGNQAPALLGLHQGVYDATLYMFLFITVAGITYIYEINYEKRANKS